MSTGARGFELHAAEYGHPPQALAEAERILAETEHAGGRGVLYCALRDLPRTEARDTPLCVTRMRDALAASLAAALESGAFNG